MDYKALLRFSFLLGGYYDIVLGIGLLFFYRILFPIFGFPIPDEPMFVFTSGLFLLAVGIMMVYIVYRLDDLLPRLIIIGFLSAMVRIGYAVIVFYRILFSDIDFGFILTAITDLLTGLLLLFAGSQYLRYNKT